MYILVVGCGRLGSELAKVLADEGHDVVVIDSKQEAFRRLGHTFNGMVEAGNGFNCEVLEDAGIKEANAVAAVTDDDNINIIVVQIAKEIYNVPITLARVYDPEKAKTYSQLGIDIISTTTVITRLFRDRLIEGELEKHLKAYRNRVEIHKVEVHGALAGKTIRGISQPGLFSVISIIRKDQLSLPMPEDSLMEGDVLVCLGSFEGRDKIMNILKGAH